MTRSGTDRRPIGALLLWQEYWVEAEARCWLDLSVLDARDDNVAKTGLI